MVVSVVVEVEFVRAPDSDSGPLPYRTKKT
jgi:hypothetical protein